MNRVLVDSGISVQSIPWVAKVHSTCPAHLPRKLNSSLHVLFDYHLMPCVIPSQLLRCGVVFFQHAPAILLARMSTVVIPTPANAPVRISLLETIVEGVR